MKIVLGTLRRVIREVLLLEDRVSDVKTKYPDLEKEIDELASSDPSGSQKYLLWGVKQLSSGVSVNDLIPTIELFHKSTSRVKNKDINSYKSLKELENELKSIAPTKTQERKATKVAGAEKIIDDDEYELIYIKDKKAAQLYGAGTKWCITMANASYFEQYTGANVVFYFALSKTLPKTDSFYKLAFAVQRDLINNVIELEIYDAADYNLGGVPEELEKLADIVTDDAPEREKSVLAKIKLGEASREEIVSSVELYKDDSITLKAIFEKIDADIIEQFVKHKSVKVRQVVSKYVDKLFLQLMMKDRDATVRYHVAKRIDQEYLPEMLEREKAHDVRLLILSRIHPSYLVNFIHDDDVEMRLAAADSVDLEHLSKMMHDESWKVRYSVAERINDDYLPEMMHDSDVAVRRAVAHRIDKSHLSEMMNDDHYSVRLAVARRIDPSYLPGMMDDESYDVRIEVAKKIDVKFLDQMLEKLDQKRSTNVLARHEHNEISSIRMMRLSK
jgi:hypothetical protein